MRDYSLEGKVVAVTGAANGWGPHFVEVFKAQGATVVAIDECNRKIAEEAVEDIEKKYGRLDILVNNLYVVDFTDDAEDTSWVKAATKIQKNAAGFASEAAKLMQKNDYGRIVNTFSVKGKFDYADQNLYYSVRKAVESVTRMQVEDMAKACNIPVNCVIPGLLKKPECACKMDEDDPMYRFGPVKRFGSIEEIDGALIALTSEFASYTTGQIICVDGGLNSVIV